MTDAQIKVIVGLAEKYRDRLLEQWALFKEGKQVKPIKITK